MERLRGEVGQRPGNACAPKAQEHTPHGVKPTWLEPLRCCFCAELFGLTPGARAGVRFCRRLVEIRPDRGATYVMDHVIKRLLSESVELHIRETERRRQCPAGAPLAWPPLASCESGGSACPAP